ncbi:unnamed protein product [Moneuplotes crassus]|uniref:Uncharacterized protein n=1 Tax=Euplotes crassus TaxID=5936 RepID=A0AAD1X9X0_EUPCR|nr:unnamed protein product [Moneuplotes crassus]
MKNKHIIPRRLQCSDSACKNRRFYFCRDHQVYSCRGCASKMHYKCQIVIIQDLTDLRTDVKEVQKLVVRFQELATENGLEVYLPNIDSVIKDYQGDLTEIERKINEAIAHDDHQQFDILRSQIREIQNHMADQQVIKDILFLSTTRNASRYGLPRVSDEFSSAIKVERTIETVVKHNIKLIEKKFASKAKEIEYQCKDRLSEEFKERIQTLQAQKEAQDIEIEEQKQATEQVLMQAQDMLKQKRETFTQNQALQSQMAQLERELSQKVKQIKRVKAQNKKDQEGISKMSEAMEENIIHVEESKEMVRDRIKNTYKDFNLDSTELALDMAEENSQKLVKAMGESKCALGDMHKLTIDRMVNEDTDLNEFMIYSSPSSLNLFVFNHSFLGGGKAVRIKFYLKGLKKILQRVTEEVYLECLVINETDLSKIVKWSSNAERLTVRYSKISTSASLDFSSSGQSKLKYLSFFNCGYSDWCNMRWDESPEKFEQIIVAIKNSSLKDSLTHINVRRCNISPSKVSELLSSHGLSHISAIDEINGPLDD